MQTDLSQRNGLLDILKGLAIIFVVWGHAGMEGTKVICTFHVPLFFIISGILHKDELPFGIFLRRKLASLWVPYVAYSVAFMLLREYVFGPLCIMSSFPSAHDKPILEQISAIMTFDQTEQLLAPLWFVSALFTAAVTFKCFSVVMPRRYRQQTSGLMAIMSVAILYLWNRGMVPLLDVEYGNLKVAAVFLAMLFYSVGVTIKCYCMNYRLRISLFVLALVLMTTLISCPVETDIRVGIYDNILFLISASVVGYLICVSVSEYLSKTRILSRFMSYCGRKSFAIMALHIVSFKLVTLIYCLAKHNNCSLLGNYGTVDFELLGSLNLSKMSYLAAGLLIPVTFALVVDVVKARIKSGQLLYKQKTAELFSSYNCSSRKARQ